jgi:hypothetical protein
VQGDGNNGILDRSPDAHIHCIGQLHGPSQLTVYEPELLHHTRFGVGVGVGSEGTQSVVPTLSLSNVLMYCTPNLFENLQSIYFEVFPGCNTHSFNSFHSLPRTRSCSPPTPTLTRPRFKVPENDKRRFRRSHASGAQTTGALRISICGEPLIIKSAPSFKPRPPTPPYQDQDAHVLDSH